MGDALLIGRIRDHQVLTNVDAVRLTDRDFEYSGRVTIDEDTIERLPAVRDQLLGLAGNPDEPFVPLEWEKDPTLDGMVRVRGASVDIEAGTLRRGWAPFRVTVERVPGGAIPNVESTIFGGWRNNNVGIFLGTNETPWHAVPAASLDYWDGWSSFQPTAVTRTTSTGAVDVYMLPLGRLRTVPRYTVPPSNWYDGAAVVETIYGSAYETVIGRHLYNGLGTSSWRLSNGLLRVAPSATPGRIEIAAFNGASWGTAKAFKLTAFDGVTAYEVNRINTVAVRRNAPEEAILRLSVGLTSGGIDYAHRTTLDLVLRRGSRLVEIRWATASNPMLGAVEPVVAEAGTGMTGGGRSNVNDANGNRILLFSPINSAFSAATCKLDSTATASNKWSFALGFEIGGSGSASPDRAVDVRNQYFGPYTERMSVVGW